MRVIHMLQGTKHRIEVRGEDGGRVGPWAQITQPATLSLNRFERVVMVTEWGKSGAFPTSSRAYIVREYEMPKEEGK